MATHLHVHGAPDAVLKPFLHASLPVALVGWWEYATRAANGIDADAWSLRLSSHVFPGDPSAAALLAGSMHPLPLLLTSVLVCGFWTRLFAHWRRLPVDPAWLLTAWLLFLLLPPDSTPGVVAAGASVAAVVGLLVFGGTGNYPLSPPLLGALCTALAYPGFTAAPLGGASATACTLGAVYLAARGTIGWRVPLGGALGAATFLTAVTALQDDAMRSVDGMALQAGPLAFVLAFIATDLTTTPLMRSVRWLLGFSIASLCLLLMATGMAPANAALRAAAIGLLCAPLADRLAEHIHAWRRQHA
ncbi:MAG: RnfABCDGE type electron transport complex subunit D [Pseudomonadales bacterium]